MNSYSFQETRRNPQTARKVTFHLIFFSPVTYDEQDGSLSSCLSNERIYGPGLPDVISFPQVPSLKPGESFCSALFNAPKSERIRNLAKESTFIQGMVKGSLDPNVYGGYMVQDAAYCFNAVDSFERAARSWQTWILFTLQEPIREFQTLQPGFSTNMAASKFRQRGYGAGCSNVRGIWTSLEPKRSQVPLHCHVTMYHAMALDCRPTHRFSRQEQPILRLV